MGKVSKVPLIQTKGTRFPFGVSYQNQSVNFSVILKSNKECHLNLYSIKTKEKAYSIPMIKDDTMQDVFTLAIESFPYEHYEYTFETDGYEFVDPYAKVVHGREQFGIKEKQTETLRGGFLAHKPDGMNARWINRPFQDMILYELHVRGFTNHKSSQVDHPGTFLGLMEKIPYIKELGVNTVLMLPIVEFDEIMERRFPIQREPCVNYWGYHSDSYYFAPKSAYASDKIHPDAEFKELVFQLHEQEIEVILDMDFKETCTPSFILECLRYWRLYYHIDGFRINVPIPYRTMLAVDPVLRTTKFLANGWDENEIQMYQRENSSLKRLAILQDTYAMDMRKFLKGDEEQIANFMVNFKKNPQMVASINYITSHDGFTLHDLYTYDIKHNEANGEANRDGQERNFGWNCGLEGETKRKRVLLLRDKLVKNAFTTLLLSQGTPLILAGDEFGNSQRGNNNAYCQDNETSWLDWGLLVSNRCLVDYVKTLIALRKEHPVLHGSKELRGLDYIYCKMPDISYHGVNVWQPEVSFYRREVAVLLCGKYAKVSRTKFDATFYLIFNMHWENHTFALPHLEQDGRWNMLISTDEPKMQSGINNSKKVSFEDQRYLVVKPRTIVVLIHEE